MCSSSASVKMRSGLTMVASAPAASARWRSSGAWPVVSTTMRRAGSVAEPGQRVEAVDDRQVEVEQHDVRRGRRRALHGVVAVAGLAGDLVPGFSRANRAAGGTGVVVTEEQPHGPRRGLGRGVGSVK